MANVQARRAVPPPVVLAATLGVAAACWGVTAWLMTGMDMGVATTPGTFGFFAAAWVTMMAAMMLPGVAPALARHTRIAGTARAALLFSGSYLSIWAVIGVAAFVLDRPHSSAVAGAVVIAAGVYELTPVKRNFRQRCREQTSSGLGLGLCCIGSSLGLMAMLVALDVMNLFLMAVIAVIVTAQKLLPVRAAIDVTLALALIGLGFVVIIDPSLIPGLTPPPM